jgi:hypothetical protein
MDFSASSVRLGALFAAAAGVSLALAAPSPGPDVIVGFVSNTQVFGREGTGAATRLAIAAATNSCNMGSAALNWYRLPDARHPVIAINLYRLINDRMEQLGQSWVKHGFLATNQGDCFRIPGFPHTSCQAQGNQGPQLRPGCSDLYPADLNADPDTLGPRSKINPTTAAFINPLTGQVHVAGVRNLAGYPASTALQRVIYALESEVLAAASTFFIEAHYVTADDALARNARNNMTFVQVRPTVDGAAAAGERLMFTDIVRPQGTGTIRFEQVTGETHGQSALSAWTGAKFFEKTEAEAAGGQLGTIIVASKAVPLSGSSYRYEYAIYNMNSHAAVQALIVPTTTAQAASVGSKAVPSFGEIWSNDPWGLQVAANGVTWATQRLSDQPLANAIRWGTTYNFWFVADSPPATKTATVWRFRPKEGAAAPESFAAEVIAPSN